MYTCFCEGIVTLATELVVLDYFILLYGSKKIIANIFVKNVNKKIRLFSQQICKKSKILTGY